MAADLSFIQLNRASTERIRALVKRVNEKDMQRAVGEHWTVAIALVHIAFWDRRALFVLDATQRAGKFVDVQPDIVVNDISVPMWGAVPPREAARLAIDTADELDKRLEAYPEGLREEIYRNNKRYVIRALHRNEHLDEVDKALKG